MNCVGKISIVIPCYNHGAMLLEALASIDRVRSEGICEIIIVNDGSTNEQTIQILRDLPASKYKVINQVNRGLGAARNTGVAAAVGGGNPHPAVTGYLRSHNRCLRPRARRCVGY